MNIETGMEEYVEAQGSTLKANTLRAHSLLSLEEIAEELLAHTTGLDVDDDHGRGTPARFIRMLEELTTSKWNPDTFTVFPNTEGLDQMVVVQKIPFVSVCNHHVIPFVGYAHVGYIPSEKIAGLSKFARVVQHFACRLQVQERLTIQVADFLEERLDPIGLAVMMSAEHMCMVVRGVQAPGTFTTTSAMRGVFSDHDRTAKAEFLRVIGNGFH